MNSLSTNASTRPTPTAMKVNTRCSTTRDQISPRWLNTQSHRMSGSPDLTAPPSRVPSCFGRGAKRGAERIERQHARVATRLVDDDRRLDRGRQQHRQRVAQRGVEGHDRRRRVGLCIPDRLHWRASCSTFTQPCGRSLASSSSTYRSAPARWRMPRERARPRRATTPSSSRHVGHLEQRQALEPAVGAHEPGHELIRRLQEQLGRRRVLGESTAHAA